MFTFYRRQVLWIAKQVLQLGMGDAFDDWLIARIQWLRREEVVASGVQWLKGVSNLRFFDIVLFDTKQVQKFTEFVHHRDFGVECDKL